MRKVEPTGDDDVALLTPLQLFMVSIIGTLSCRDFGTETVKEYVSAMGESVHLQLENSHERLFSSFRAQGALCQQELLEEPHGRWIVLRRSTSSTVST